MNETQSIWKKTPHGIRLCNDGTTIELTAYGASCVRISAWRGPDKRLPSLAVVAKPQLPATAKWILNNNSAHFESSAGRIIVKEDGSVQCETPAGGLLFTENAGARLTGSGNIRDLKKSAPVAATFRFPKNTCLYGLGQFPDGIMNRRGTSLELVQGNTQVVVPFLVTESGLGLLWDQAGTGRFEDGPNGTRLTANSGRALDYVVCFGKRIDDAIAGYRFLTGRAAMLPKWAYGYWQSKERYKSGEELAGTVDEFRKRHFPMDVIVQDWEYWGDRSLWSSMVYNPKQYGDLPAAVRRIHEQNARVAISIWPVLGPKTAIFKELKAAGRLFTRIHWSSGRLYDPFSAKAREIYWKHARSGLWNNGVDGWWMDATEPEYGDPFCGGLNAVSIQEEPKQPERGTWAELMSAYSLETTHGFWDHQRKASKKKRVCILTRSAWAGQQRYGAITWSGDIGASWPMLRSQVAAGLQFCMAGIPFWTTDIGGFFTGFRGGQFPQGVEDPAYRELYVRWFQYGAFCPIFRSHGTQTPREPWQFGKPGHMEYDTLLAFDRLRYRLLPYHYTLAGQAYHNHGTPMRALVMDFPDDPRSRKTADEFMYGPALLVAPVLEPLYHDPSDAMPVVQPEALIMPDGVFGRVKVRHLRGRNGNKEVHSFASDNIDFSFAGSAPTGLGDTDYQIRVEGSLVALESGSHKLMVRADGDIRLSLDGRNLINARCGSEIRTETCSINLEHGRSYKMELVYGHGAGKGALQLGWITPARQNAVPAAKRAKERKVYLPPGTWYDFWTGERLKGGREIRRPATLDTMPLLVRAGSVLPLGPDIEWTGQDTGGPLELRIYPGANGSGEWYDDAGDGYDYEKSAFCTIPWKWSDRDRTLTIGARKGAYKDMQKERSIRVVIVRPGAGTGIEPTAVACRGIKYKGRILSVTPDE